MTKRYTKALTWLGLAIFVLVVAIPFIGNGNPNRRYVTSPMRARGFIRDLSGVQLTKYTEIESAGLDLKAAGMWRDGNPDEWRRFSEKLANSLEIDPENIKRHLDHPGQFRYLKRWLTTNENSRLRQVLNEEWSNAWETVRITREPKTYFPFGEPLAALLGFTNIDGQGASGLEFQYEKELAGRVNGTAGYWSFSPRKGSDLYLTIDLELQRACEFLLEPYMEKYRAESIEMVVLRPSDSKVLAVVSRPAFDPNNFRTARPAQMRLRPVTDIFQMGPMIQPFFIAEGMETTRDGLAEQWTPGSSVPLSEEFLDQSPETPLNVAKALGLEGTRRAISRFRLDQRTGVDFESEPLPMVARSTHPESDLLEFAQGYGVAVPLHRLALSFCALVNGGELREPKFVDRLEMPDGNIERMPAPPVFNVLKPEYSTRIRELLTAAVKRADKEGASPGMGGMWATFRDKSSLPVLSHTYVTGAFFAPADKPKVVVALKMILPKDPGLVDRDLGLHMGRETLETALRHLDVDLSGGAHEHR